jgi:hypothetical protein
MMMTIKNSSRMKELEKAKAFAKAVGFIFDESPRHTPAIKLVQGDEAKIITPIFFEVGEDKLIDIYNKLKSLGLSGKIVLKALIKSYNNLTQAEGDDFRNCCFVDSYGPKEFLRFVYDWCVCQLEVQKISIGASITKNSTRNMWFSLGRYRGLKAFFEEALTVTLYEFRRVKSIEEKLDSAKEQLYYNTNASNLEKLEAQYVLLQESTEMLDGGIVLKKAHDYVEFNPCMTCAKCRVDRYGVRKCKECMIHIDPNMTVGEVNKIYPRAVINNYGVLRSEYIMSNVHRCSYYTERIGSKIKTVKNYKRYENVVAEN